MATAKTREVRNAFSEVPNPQGPAGIKPAKQEFKDDADINSIMRKFQKTGTINHSAKYQPQYGETTPITYHESMNIVTGAQTMFNELPSSIRKKFENSAANFLEFVQDESNYEEAQELGLDLAPEAHSAAVERMEREKAESVVESALQGQDAPGPADSPTP